MAMENLPETVNLPELNVMMNNTIYSMSINSIYFDFVAYIYSWNGFLNNYNNQKYMCPSSHVCSISWYNTCSEGVSQYQIYIDEISIQAYNVNSLKESESHS